MRRLLAFCAAAAVTVLLTSPSHAFIEPGSVAPDFSKDELVNQNYGPIWTLYNHTLEVTVVFPLGYS